MATGEIEAATNTIEFPHFDILSGDSAYSDHHYVHSKKSKKSQDCFNQPTSAVSKAIAKEWKILEKGLPESIYVRAYEQRIDLFRAVIVGAAGTPYHDGLFFFDIALPSDYPKQPPRVYYHAHGLCLNPNLYATGKVCLSLIRTWYGRGMELWKPANSTILQLLVSIQGLVLNSKPFFNEPGREHALHSKANHWTKLSMAYNAEVLILSCRTMLYNLRRPPNGFRSFVVEHFREHGDFILAAISAYRNGDAIVGQYQEGGSVSSSSYLPRNFKANLERIHSDLRLAFMGIDTSPTKMKNLALTSVFMGIDTSPTKMKNLALTSVRKEKGETAAAVKKSQSSVKQPKQGISGKIFNVLKKIFQCKTGKDVKAIA